MSNAINFQSIQEPFEALAGSSVFQTECGFAKQAISNSPALQEVWTNRPETILAAVLNVARVGLTLNPISGYAVLIPRWQGQKGKVCVLEPQYQGLVKLVMDTGSVVSLAAYPVYKGDHFKAVLGSAPRIEHEPMNQSREVIASYAIAKLHDGSHQYEVMNNEDITEVADCSESYKAYKKGKIKKTVWTEWMGEMARKAVIKRLCKFLPKTDNWKHIQEAIAVDNSQYDLGATFEQLNYIENALQTPSLHLGDRERDNLVLALEGQLSRQRASEIIDGLKTRTVPAAVTEGHLPLPNSKEMNLAVSDRMLRDKDPKS